MGDDGIREIVVVVPARDEAARIGLALHALDRARSALHRATAGGVSCRIVVVADGCDDATAAIARLRLVAPPDLVIEGGWRCVGRSRQVGARIGLDRSPYPSDRVWLASTDADTVVEESWLLDHLRVAETGYHALAGTVRLLLDADADADLDDWFRRTYAIGEDGHHLHVHAANLGVRADVYEAVGGWTALAVGEDHDLWSRLQVGGWRLHQRARPWVHTSARRRARAPQGFAADLAGHVRVERRRSA